MVLSFLPHFKPELGTDTNLQELHRITVMESTPEKITYLDEVRDAEIEEYNTDYINLMNCAVDGGYIPYYVAGSHHPLWKSRIGNYNSGYSVRSPYSIIMLKKTSVSLQEYGKLPTIIEPVRWEMGSMMYNKPRNTPNHPQHMTVSNLRYILLGHPHTYRKKKSGHEAIMYNDKGVTYVEFEIGLRAIIDINITGVYHVTVMQDFSIIYIELLALGTHKKQENLRLIPNGVRYHMLKQICSSNLVVINEQFDYHPVVNDDEDYSSVVIESPFSPTHLERGGKSLVVGTAVKLKQNIELTVKVNGANIIDITYDFRTDSIYGNERVRRAVKGLGFGVITYSVYDKLINQCVFADYENFKEMSKKVLCSR